MFPKIIWRYWDQGWNNAPFMVQSCSESVKHYAKDFEIIDLDRKSINNYIDLPIQLLQIKDFPIATLSDLIRIRLLKKYGGVWIDATVFLNTELTPFLEPLDGDFFCFWRHKEKIAMSSWFLAAIKGSYIAQEVETLFSKIITTSFITDNEKYFKKWNNSPNYFIFHKTFEGLIKSDEKFAYFVHEMPFMDSFPILATAFYGWNKDIVNDFASLINSNTPMIKLSHSVSKENYNEKGHLEVLLNKMCGGNNKIYEHNHVSFSLRTTSLYNSFCNTPKKVENFAGPFESESDLKLCTDKFPRWHIYNFPSMDKKFLSQLCIPYGANRIFIRSQAGNNFSPPREVAYKDEIELLRNELLIVKNSIYWENILDMIIDIIPDNIIPIVDNKKNYMQFLISNINKDIHYELIRKNNILFMCLHCENEILCKKYYENLMFLSYILEVEFDNNEKRIYLNKQTDKSNLKHTFSSFIKRSIAYVKCMK